MGGCDICGPPPPILTSTDGVNWTAQRGTEAWLNGVAFGGGQFVAVGGTSMEETTGIITTSADGVHWVRHEVLKGANLWDVAYGNGHFVAVGDLGIILESGSIIDLMLSRKPDTGLISLALEGPMAADYTIQASRDLISWQSLTNINTGVTGSGALALPATSERLFYRALSQ